LDSIDAVIPIPETGFVSAYAVSKHLKKPYCQGFVKNRYIFRTFIMPSQSARQRGVRAKLNVIPVEFKDKNVLLVDDSIVRGTTSREIVNMVREAGAKKVFFSSCAPPIANSHIYGIDLASPKELVAYQRDSKAIAEHIGADTVIYQTLQDLEEACAQDSPRDPKTQHFEVGVFCGKYVTPVGEEYFRHLEEIRGEVKKAKVMESARDAVRYGYAGAEQVKMATNGALVRATGEVVARDSEVDSELRMPYENDTNGVNGIAPVGIGSNGGSSSGRPEAQSRDSQDPALHNFNDYEEA